MASATQSTILVSDDAAAALLEMATIATYGETVDVLEGTVSDAESRIDRAKLAVAMRRAAEEHRLATGILGSIEPLIVAHRATIVDQLRMEAVALSASGQLTTGGPEVQGRPYADVLLEEMLGCDELLGAAGERRQS
jgi:hypothetical protein